MAEYAPLPLDHEALMRGGPFVRINPRMTCNRGLNVGGVAAVSVSERVCDAAWASYSVLSGFQIYRSGKSNLDQFEE